MGELINFDFDDMNEKLDRIEARLDEINELLSGVMKEIEGEEMNKDMDKSRISTTYDVNIKYNNE
jgi:hypothetical protein